MTETDVSYREGEQDFNGNYQVPVEGEPYLMVSVLYKNGDDKYRYLGIQEGVFKNRGTKC